MDPKKITILYDAAEDEAKAEAEAEGKPCPLAYCQVAEALGKRGHSVRTVAVNAKISRLVDELEKDGSDVIFNLCEANASPAQKEHTLAGLLELYEKCFTGTGSAGFVLAADKALAKKILQFHDLRFPRFCTFAQGRVEWSDDLDFPLIVKPVDADASLGIDSKSVVQNVNELLTQVAKVQEEFGGAALVEEFIEGREIYVGVIGNGNPEAFPLLEWDLSAADGPRIAGAEAKWDRQSAAFKTQLHFPEDIPADVAAAIQQAAVTAFQALRLSGYGRVDLRVTPPSGKSGKSKEWSFHIIEVNPNCWLEKRDEFAVAARKHGLSYPDMLERIITLALEQRGKQP